MKIDAQQIINETIAVFEKSGAVEIYKKAVLVKDEDYKRLHPFPLTPTMIKINSNLFNSEIKQFDEYFEKWGTDHQDLERYGLALVNQDGKLKANDPINGSLMAWNKNNPTMPLLETDCLNPTNVMSMISMHPLNIFEGHWCRSNIFKWHNGAFFFPHIDTIVPSMWIRLWATTSPDIVVRFHNPATGELEEFKDIELGRIYIIDTSIVHDARTTGDNVHQLFLSILPSAVDLLKRLSL